MKRIGFLTILAAGILLSGCGSGDKASYSEGTDDQSQDEAMKAPSTTQRDYAYEQRDQYVAAVKDEIQKIDGRLEDLLRKARESATPISPELQSQIDALRARRDALSNRLGETTTMAADAWAGWKQQIDTELSDLRAQVDRTYDRVFQGSGSENR